MLASVASYGGWVFPASRYEEPAKLIANPMTDSLQRLWSEFSGMTDNAKRIGLRGQKRFCYIFSIGTEVEHRGKGGSTGL